MTWFNKQSRIVQLILLLIPVVNWIVELVVRWSTWAQKGGLVRLVICILTIVFGIIFGWIASSGCCYSRSCSCNSRKKTCREAGLFHCVTRPFPFGGNTAVFLFLSSRQAASSAPDVYMSYIFRTTGKSESS